jgi:hypothetical protein
MTDRFALVPARRVLRRAAALLFGAAATLAAPAALAQDADVKWAGRVQTDLRFRVAPVSVGNWYDRMEMPAGVARNENLVGATFNVRYGDVSAVADLDFVLYGVSRDFESIGDLALREEVDPFRFDVHQLYFQVNDFLLDGLDLRVGQQLAQWGVGDQFNPTNVQNADDVEDPLRFGDQLGNAMVRLDYWFTDEWSHTAVLIPIFKPAALPNSAPLGLARVDRTPVTNDFLRWRIHAEQASAAGQLLGHPTIVSNVTPVLPDTSFENMQFAYKLGGSIEGHDIALSFYRGRNDVPLPRTNHARHDPTPRCNPDNSRECIQGAILNDVTLEYPRMSVFGLNATGEVGWLKEISDSLNAIGYRLEGALFLPERRTMKITQDALALAIPQPAGEYDYDDDGRPGGREPAVLENTPFLKWVLGLDYTFDEHVYTNIQWIHGFVDEFGAGDFINEGYNVVAGGVSTEEDYTILRCALPRDGTTCARELQRPKLGDYLMALLEVKFADAKATARLLGILYLNGTWEEYFDPVQGKRVREHHDAFSELGYSVVIYPEFGYNFGNGLELGAGALFQLGDENSRFGDPQGGGSLVWTRGKYSF